MEMIKKTCFGPESYCTKLWHKDADQIKNDKHIPCSRISIITSIVCFLLSILFCVLSLQYHRPLNTYLILFGVSFGSGILSLFIRICCMEPPKAMPKKEKVEDKKKKTGGT